MKTTVLPRSPIGNKNRRYRQEEFIISTFKTDGSDPKKVISQAKKLNFNMVEFAWVTPEKSIECMKVCEQEKIKGIFQNWDIFGGFQASKGKGAVNIPELEKYIEQTRKNDYVAGYYVWDEPLEDEKIKEAAAQVELIEKLDPDRIPFTVAIPSYNLTHTWKNGKFEGYLKNYADIIEPAVMSLDYYPFVLGVEETSDQLDKSELFLDIALLREIALKKDIPMWFYFQTQDDPPHQKYINFSPEKLRMQQFNAILHGTKGLQNFNIYEGALNSDGTPGPLYSETQEINRRCKQWGRTLMALTSKHVFHSPEVLKDDPNFECFRERPSESRVLNGEELPKRCSIGEFEDASGNIYLFIQNRDYEKGRKFEIGLKENMRIFEVSSDDGLQKLKNENTDCIKLNLSPADALLLRLDSTEKEPYLIEYELKKQ